MQWPNHDIQPPRKPHGSRIDRRIQRYPPPVSGNAEPSSMYAMAVNMVTTKFRPNARTSEGPVILKPGPTSRKIVVPIVGPSPIIVISKSPRSRRNLTSTSRPCAIGSRQNGSPLLALGGSADGFQIHEGIVEFRHVAERSDGPRGSGRRPSRSPARQCQRRHKADGPAIWIHDAVASDSSMFNGNVSKVD